MKKPIVLIAGSGPAGLMAAHQLLDIADVHIIDHNKAAGRKFLVAGDGGLNLTHSEELTLFVQRYDHPLIQRFVEQFSPADLCNWLTTLGITTRVGSSGKVFPIDGIKPIEVLNAILAPLKDVTFHFQTEILEFDSQGIRVADIKSLQHSIPYDYLILALGGASWKVTGSDGSWTSMFLANGIDITPFQPSNAGIELPDTEWCSRYEGTYIKNVRVRTNDQVTAGDLTVTSYGLEGKPVYAANAAVRRGEDVFVDFKPQLSPDDVGKILQGVNARKGFRKLSLPDSVYELLKAHSEVSTFRDAHELASLVKSFRLTYSGLRELDEAISTVGGISMEEITETSALKRFPNIYCCGEMLDWDAPTGGYLLQACFASGWVAGKEIRENILTGRSGAGSPIL